MRVAVEKGGTKLVNHFDDGPILCFLEKARGTALARKFRNRQKRRI